MRELREAVRKARAQTGLGAGGAPLPRPPNLAEARRHVQDVQRAQHPQLPGQTPLLRRAKGAAYRAPKEPRGAVGGLRVVSGSSPVPRWKALEASYLRGEAGLSCAQRQPAGGTNPSPETRPAQRSVWRKIAPLSSFASIRSGHWSLPGCYSSVTRAVISSPRVEPEPEPEPEPERAEIQMES